MTDYLASLSTFQWTCIALGSWLIVACLVAPSMGRCIRGPKPATVDDDTRWLPFLPPVPPSRPVGDDWMALVPVDCLSDAEVSDLFEDLVRLGGLK